MGRQKIVSSHCQFFLDTCAFDPKCAPEDEAAQRLWAAYESEKIKLLLSHSNQREIDHPNTPVWVKQQALTMIYTLDVTLTKEEKEKMQELENLLRGNAQTDKHKDDAHHLFEAAKYGGYFITTDHRILGKVKEVFECCGVQVLTPSNALYRMGLPDNA